MTILYPGLRELAKTCNFWNNDCLQKALRDQIIEGLLDGKIIQELLQVKARPHP